MKFTKEDAFDELKKQLKAIVGDPAINDKAITETVATLLPLLANDDTELSEFATKILPVLKTGDGNARKYASNAVKRREKELVEGAEKDAAANPEPGAGEDDRIAKLLERIDALEKAKAETDRQAAVATKREALARAIEAQGVKDREWVNDLLCEVLVDETTDTESAAERYVRLYNKSHARTPASVSPGAASDGDGGKGLFDDVAEYRKARGEAERGNITTN